ncbi:hypothetical protein [Aporhodopirellula aestuarii]|uniref:Uncharacterized protein n=1 Tax=Aporhodopirellula aestuarii TaxID=2950107 RepID=A0ABT0TZ60_9BACT|nr:hypothetical protein [Aporhodopirellula aestuarii]MCM2369892.1 hypothetical protein [Aporhodopirellula aestuarii]
MAKTEEPPISEDTIEMIESQVKKGKARKFFLIYKGASIKTLVVFKKGPFGPKIMKAKKDGFKGDVCYGVVTGSGKNLFFQLPANGEVAAAMKVESWEEKPPTKKAKLREFLNGCGLSFKPEFNMITKVSDAPDPESESDIPAPPPPPGSAVADEDGDDALPLQSQPESATASQNSAGQNPTADFKQRLAALLPRIKAAAGTDAGDNAKQKVSEAGVFARKQETNRANVLLDEAEQLLKRTRGIDGGDDDFARATKLAETLKKLKPLADRIIDSDQNRRSELFDAMARIAGEIKAKQFDQAKQSITDFASFLKLLSTQQLQGTQREGADWITEFTTLRDELESRLFEAQRADREGATKLSAAWDYAKEQAAAGNFDNSLKALVRLEKAINQILAVPDSVEGDSTNANQTPTAEALSRWRMTQAKVASDLEVFRKTLLASEAVKSDPRFRFVSAASAEIPNMLPPEGRRLAVALSGNKEPNEVIDAAAAYRDALQSSRRLEQLEQFANASLGVPLAVRETLSEGIEYVENIIRSAI